jgi:hypothetical protein
MQERPPTSEELQRMLGEAGFQFVPLLTFQWEERNSDAQGYILNIARACGRMQPPP